MTIPKNTSVRFAGLGALIMAGALTFTGCTVVTNGPGMTPAPTEAATSVAADGIAMHDAWIKAVDSGMTGAFGEIENTGTTDVTVVSVSTDIAAMVELHETVETETGDMKMRQVEGGFDIPAGGTLLLEPGANHIMLMGIESPLIAGDIATFTITFSDDSTFEFEAPVKDYTGANETYDDVEHSDHEGMDH